MQAWARNLSTRGSIGKHDLARPLRATKRTPSRCMATNSAGNRANTRSQAASPSQPERSNNVGGNGASSSSQDAPSPGDYTPLRLVVKDAVKRWFNEAHKEATKGDIKQQALLGQMMIEGYGCKPTPELGREWTERARKRGYKMAGVYCEI